MKMYYAVLLCILPSLAMAQGGNYPLLMEITSSDYSGTCGITLDGNVSISIVDRGQQQYGTRAVRFDATGIQDLNELTRILEQTIAETPLYMGTFRDRAAPMDVHWKALKADGSYLILKSITGLTGKSLVGDPAGKLVEFLTFNCTK